MLAWLQRKACGTSYYVVAIDSNDKVKPRLQVEVFVCISNYLEAIRGVRGTILGLAGDRIGIET